MSPISSNINTKLNLIHHVCAGKISSTDVIAAFDRVVADKDFHPGMSVIWDFHKARINVGPEELQALVTHVGLKRQNRGTGYRLAIVADDAMMRMLADIFKALASPLSFEVQIFPTPDEAIAWVASASVPAKTAENAPDTVPPSGTHPE